MLKVRDEEFIKVWQSVGSPTAVAKHFGMALQSVLARRKRLQRLKGVTLATVAAPGYQARQSPHGWDRPMAHAVPPRAEETVANGTVLVFSDAHYWPGIVTLAHEALCKLARALAPKLIIGNGDLFDGANISRHDPLGWQKLPTVIEELDAVKTRLAEIRRSAPRAKTRMTAGNHDTRFDRRLATDVGQFEDVPGMRLSDHLTDWPMSYSVMLNDALGEPVMVRHAMRGGIHAVYNNTLHAGVSIVTGHLHAQLCRPFTDYRGTRYGVDCGTLADTNGPQFSYTMDGPVNWRSGFAVLTFDGEGRLLPPELCEVQRIGKAQRAIFRGEIVCERAAP